MERRISGILVIAVIFVICLSAIGIVNDGERKETSPEFPIVMRGDASGTVSLDTETFEPDEARAEIYIYPEYKGRGLCVANLWITPDAGGGPELIEYRYRSEPLSPLPDEATPVDSSRYELAYTDPLTGDVLTFQTDSSGVHSIRFDGRTIHGNEYLTFSLTVHPYAYSKYVNDSLGPLADPVSCDISGSENGVALDGKVSLEPAFTVKSITEEGRAVGYTEFYHVSIDVQGSSIPAHILDRITWVNVDDGIRNTFTEGYLNGNTYTSLEYRLYVDDGQMVFEGEIRTETLDGQCETVSEDVLRFEYRGGVS